MAPPAVVDVDLLESRGDYLDALGRGDRRGATQVAVDLLDRGLPADLVLTELVSRVQVEVGLAWQEARWSVAREHRASEIAGSVLSAVARRARAQAPTAAARDRGQVVVACVEGEWHVLPGRLVSEVLRLNGFAVDFVGPSAPAADLAGFLGRGSPAVVALTCSMPAGLVGAWRTITALRAAGKVVVCGGRGFGPGGQWGVALGADAGADDLSAGIVALDDAIGRPAGVARPDAVGTPVAGEIALASREMPAVVAAATHLAVAHRAGAADDADWVREARGMLTLTGRAVLAATLVGDDRIVIDHVRWAESVLAARSIPTGLVAEAFRLLSTAMPADLTRSLATVRAGLAACHDPAPSDRPAPRR